MQGLLVKSIVMPFAISNSVVAMDLFDVPSILALPI